MCGHTSRLPIANTRHIDSLNENVMIEGRVDRVIDGIVGLDEGGGVNLGEANSMRF